MGSFVRIWTLGFGAWAAGFLYALLRLNRSYARLRRICRQARRIALAELGCDRSEIRSLRMGATPLGLSAEVPAPMLAGWFRPMILLPADIRDWTTEAERTAILQHEWSHLQRRDHYTNFFQALLGAIFFFHPLVRYACRQLNIERELACDESVLSFGAPASAYAEGLLKVAERTIWPDALHEPAAFASRKTLERRIQMIMKKDRRPVLYGRWPHLVMPLLWMRFSLAHRIVYTHGDRTVTYRIASIRKAPSFSQNPYQLAVRPNDTRFRHDIPPQVEVQRTKSGHLLVRPRIDGQDLGWFLLDTGATAMTISPKVLEKIKGARHL